MRPAKTITLIVAAFLAAMISFPAEAAAPARVDLRGVPLGSYVIDEAGAAHLTGDVTGKPFNGSYTAVLSADDGTLPEPGVCETGTATVEIAGAKGRHLQLVGAGRLCGLYTGPTNTVTHKFVGRYTVTASSTRNALGTDGWYSLLLVTEGRANLEAIDT